MNRSLLPATDPDRLRHASSVLLCALLLAALPAALPAAASLDNELDLLAQRIESGQADQAIPPLEALAEQHPDAPEPRFMLANALTAAGRYPEAVDVYRALTRDFPDRPEPHNNLAVIYVELDRLEDARTALLAAARLRPDYARAQVNLGDLYMLMADASYARANAIRDGVASMRADAALPASARDRFAAATTDSLATAESPAPMEPPPPSATESETDATDPTARRQPSPLTGAARRRVLDAVDAWARAWSAQAVAAYLDSYGPDFRPADGSSVAAWRQLRSQRLSAPEWIEVRVDIENIDFRDDDTVVVELRQDYRASNYQDQSNKRLTLSEMADRYLIIAEESI